MSFAYLSRVEKLDHAAVLTISRFRRPALNVFFGALTWTGHGAAWMIAVVTLVFADYYELFQFPQREVVLRATLAAGIGWFIAKLIKTTVPRARPFQVFVSVPRLTPAPSDDSFPSGHAAAAVAFAVAMTPLGLVIATPIALWALLVSFSRYYLGVHFPSDIVAGALIGVIAGVSMIIAG